MIVYGKVLDGLGASCYAEAVTDARDPFGWRVRSRYAVEREELSGAAAPCPLTAGHRGREIGRVRYLETRSNGDTFMVADATGTLSAGNERGELFLSVEGFTNRGRLYLDSVAVVANPAMVLLPPIKITADATIADLPETVTLCMRSRQPFDAALLERARAATRRRRPDDRPVLFNATPADASSPTAGWLDRDDQRPAGELWIRPGGAILSVH